MKQYDAIIVGARCGGAPLAMLLAKAGHQVLLVDRMAFGTDIMSTHYVKRSGASLLNQWGLLDAVRAVGTPAIEQLTFEIDGTRLSGNAPPYEGVATDFTPRRFYLDKILVDAAIEAGAEVRDEFSVTDLLFDDGRVTGIKGAAKGGAEVSERAKIVVGADGVRSLVAKTVAAEHTIDAGTHTCGHYAYYSGMRESDSSAELRILTDKRRFFITFPTNDELDMVFLFWPAAEAKQVRANLDNAYAESLRLVPELEARVQAGTRETRISGTHLLPNFFRQAHGPGWALVGDAALHRDPITAQGITNAFTHAAILAQELDSALQGGSSLDSATAAYDQRQFQLLKPMFDYTVHLAMLQALPEEMRQMLPMVANDPSATTAFIGAFMGSVPLDKVFPPSLLDRFAADVERGQQEQRNVA
ncbi:NAD(P)/FAD-dependent oxidoreductase [Pseudomonadales bacterium]|nr:NAD(P)/FAD-dependent oxidoreductase [Pseudomonadales bacterium]MDB9756267.1 NAD(P)/FAD-dependent oxidoreductase [Pseudomonadales bacterium]MDC1322042.1 NAD(P)/FAD-dependent oxidoreductase [Pseudomonadales bacterium]